MDRVRNEEVHRRAGIEMVLASRADQKVLRWFGLCSLSCKQISCIHRKCQTRVGVSGDVRMSTITDSKSSNKSSGMNDAKEHFNKWANNMT